MQEFGILEYTLYFRSFVVACLIQSQLVLLSCEFWFLLTIAYCGMRCVCCA